MRKSKLWPILLCPNEADAQDGTAPTEGDEPGKKIEFNAVVANPPFILRWESSEAMADDFRFKGYGLSPNSAADFAFLLHGVHYLSNEGAMVIILPHGVLFSDGAKKRICSKLLNDKNIGAVIGLPPKIFYSESIPVCILVLKKCRKKEDVLFINASEHFVEGKRQNSLSEEHINRIVESYRYRK